MTPEQLTGQSCSHLVGAVDAALRGHQLLPATLTDFIAMRSAAQAAGFDLRIASSFRPFERQLAIWNQKFMGQRPVLDANSQPINIHNLNDEQRIYAILRWSALPGTSRHHWGSDLDIYDGKIASQGYQLALIPSEYQFAGPCYDLYLWLQQHAAHFGFTWPYTPDRDGVAPEPWHLSHHSALAIRPLVNLSVVQQCLESSPILAKDSLFKLLPTLLKQFCY